MGTGEVKEREALVQLSYFRAVVVGQEELALDVLQRISQSDVVIPSEAHLVHILGGEVRRIGVEEGIGTVIVFDERFEILVFHDDVCHTGLQLGDQSEEFSDVEGLRGVGFSAAGVAESQELEEHGGTADIVIFGYPCAYLHQLPCFGRWEQYLRQLQFFREVQIVKDLVLEKPADGYKVLTGV